MSNNLIFISGGAFEEVRKALNQWMRLYSADIPDDFRLELYRNGRGNHVVKVDEQLGNKHFLYLLNYLKYPEGTEFKGQLTSSLLVRDKQLFPERYHHQLISLFIPDSDKDYDNVYWIAPEGDVFRTDFNGKTEKVNAEEYPEKYEIRSVNLQQLGVPVRIRKPFKNMQGGQEKTAKENVGKRFGIIAFIVILVMPGSWLFSETPDTFLSINGFLGLGIWGWFIFDYRMLRIKRWYFLSIAISICLLLYVKLIQAHFENFDKFEVTKIVLLLPLSLLIIQKPFRLAYLWLLKREPVVDRPAPSVADLVYSLVLTLLSLFIPFMLAIL